MSQIATASAVSNNNTSTKARGRGVKRYNLVLPVELFSQIEEIANDKNQTIVGVLRQFIMLGLLAVEMEDKSEAELIIRDGDQEKLLKLWL